MFLQIGVTFGVGCGILISKSYISRPNMQVVMNRASNVDFSIHLSFWWFSF